MALIISCSAVSNPKALVLIDNINKFCSVFCYFLPVFDVSLCLFCLLLFMCVKEHSIWAKCPCSITPTRHFPLSAIVLIHLTLGYPFTGLRSSQQEAIGHQHFCQDFQQAIALWDVWHTVERERDDGKDSRIKARGRVTQHSAPAGILHMDRRAKLRAGDLSKWVSVAQAAGSPITAQREVSAAVC